MNPYEARARANTLQTRLNNCSRNYEDAPIEERSEFRAIVREVKQLAEDLGVKIEI